MNLSDGIRRWACHACGTQVSSNSTGQVRDETGSHHNPGGDRCVRVMQDQRDLSLASLAEIREIVTSWSGAHSEAVQVLSRVKAAITASR